MLFYSDDEKWDDCTHSKFVYYEKELFDDVKGVNDWGRWRVVEEHYFYQGWVCVIIFDSKSLM